jgi:adenosylcobinamide kinase/adenosylcobinamide-phosphate guanylyltransferase
VLYVATATITDPEMAERIAQHRAERPSAWQTLEEPKAIAATAAAALRNVAAEQVSPQPIQPAALDTAGSQPPQPTVLVEDLTLLLSNLLDGDPATAEQRSRDEIDALLRLEANVLLVSNEVGMGIVPPYPSGRAFRDALGRLNQHAAAQCKDVVFLIAGLPLRLKGVATIDLD